MKFTKEYFANELNRFEDTQDGALLRRLISEARYYVCENGKADRLLPLRVYADLLTAMRLIPDGWLLINYGPVMLNNLLVAWESVDSINPEGVMHWHILDEGSKAAALAQMKRDPDVAQRYFTEFVKAAIIRWQAQEKQISEDTDLPWWKVTVMRTVYGTVTIQAASEEEAADIVYGVRPAHGGACWQDTFVANNPEGVLEFDDSFGDEAVVRAPCPPTEGASSETPAVESFSDADERNVVRVELRDCNGHRYAVECFESQVCKVFGDEDTFNDDTEEIMAVYHRGTCIYSGLGNDNPLTFEDLIGFFA